jgi:hypothetical protein
MIQLTISHFRFPRRIARYSDQGRVFWPPCDTSVDLRRIEDSTFLRELTARMFLRDMQCKANGEGRRVEDTMVVVLLFGGLVQENELTHVQMQPNHYESAQAANELISPLSNYACRRPFF